MNRLLVVDDCPVDRALLCRLLSANADWKIDTACDGGAALQQLRRGPVDLVITDLQMPLMDGLELVREIRKTWPQIPVLLVTAYGSEPESIAALRAGAVNFSHKSRLRQDLVPTARAVLEWADRIRSWPHSHSHETAVKQMAFVLDNDVGSVPRLIEAFSDYLPNWARPDELRISMALGEALTNAICHGNLEVHSRFKENPEDSAYERRVSVHLDCEPFCQRRVRVTATFSTEQIEFCIHDEGRGFDPESLVDPRDPEQLNRAGGRGLLLIRAFMDEVRHNVVGNEITLIKRRSQDAGLSSSTCDTGVEIGEFAG